MTYLLDNVVRTRKTLDLDRHCFRFFVLMLEKMIYADRPLRFNELYRLIVSSRIRVRGMSKPTFTQHLRHLVNKDMLKRQRKGKQNVIYFLNEENPYVLKGKEIVDAVLPTQKITSQDFRRMTVDETAVFIANLSTTTNLNQTRLLIEGVLKPPTEQYSQVIAFSLTHAYLQRLLHEMLRVCRNDKEACIRSLRVLEKAIALKRKELDKLVHDLTETG